MVILPFKGSINLLTHAAITTVSSCELGVSTKTQCYQIKLSQLFKSWLMGHVVGGWGALLQSFLTLDTRTDVICFSAAQHKPWGNVTNFFPSCTRVIKMVALCSEYICAVQSGCDYICPPLLLSFLLRGDSTVKSWTAAKRGRPAAQLKLLQAKQEETQGAIREGKEKKKKSERSFRTPFFYSDCFFFL